MPSPPEHQFGDPTPGGSDVSGRYMRNELDTLNVEASDLDAGHYCLVDIPLQPQTAKLERIRDPIGRVQADLKDLQHFYTVTFSSRRERRFRKFYKDELADLKKVPFRCYDQGEKIDYLLLQTYLQGNLGQLTFESTRNETMNALLPFASTLVQLCEDRQDVRSMDAQKTGQAVSEMTEHLICLEDAIQSGAPKLDRTSAFHAAKTVDQLRDHLKEWFEFYNGYDPMFTWWVAEPYRTIHSELEKYSSVIRGVLVGISPKDESAIIGDPIGREGLIADLNAEHIPYNPDEVLKIGEIEYAWCEAEMKKASRELGYGDDWRKALEYVKTLYVEPGKQTQLVHDLTNEAIGYVTKHDLITVPPLATETIAMYMMSPKRQLESPFFSGMTRDSPKHRRISHLGHMTPEECVDLLVHKGGHERATAEGEVRRSFGGDYVPLYQAGYMLGALQLYSLRQELVDGGLMSEEQFHDRVMQEGPMPIELLRALMKEESLHPDQKTSWRFYKGLETGKAAASDGE